MKLNFKDRLKVLMTGTLEEHRQAFLRGDDPEGLAALRASDLEVVRVLEDLIQVLIEKGVIQFTELPEPAQKKLLQRKRLRRSSDLTLFDDDEGLI